MDEHVYTGSELRKGNWWGWIILLFAFTGHTIANCPHQGSRCLPKSMGKEMILAYPGDVDAGKRIIDVSGKGNHGALIGVEYTCGRGRSRVLHFEGLRDHVVVPKVSLNAFTFSAWVRTETCDVDNRILMRLANHNETMSIQGNSHGSIGFVLGADREVNHHEASFKPGRWVHIGVSYDGFDVKLYSNGRLIHTQALNAVLPMQGTLTLGGSRSKQGRSWQGSMDDIILVDRVLTGHEVRRLYSVGRELPVRPSLVDPDTVIIEAYIDDTCELHIIPDLLYWTNNSEHAKPGRLCNRNEATWINGRPWRPKWNSSTTKGVDMSSQYGLTIEPALFAPELVAVGKCRETERVERGCIDAYRDGSALIIRFEDPKPGARWYRVRLYRWQYVDPVKQLKKPEICPLVKATCCKPRCVEPVKKEFVVVPAQPVVPVSPPPVMPAQPKPQIVVQATDMPPVPKPVVQSQSMIIDAYIDELSDLWIKGDGLIWKNVTAAAKPGRAKGRNEPTWINGQAWYPAWIDEDGEAGIDLSELRPHPLAPGFYKATLVAVGQSRDQLTDTRGSIETIPLAESLVVRFDDPNRKPSWYRILVTRQPSKNRW